jgi:hypothetical protein
MSGGMVGVRHSRSCTSPIARSLPSPEPGRGAFLLGTTLAALLSASFLASPAAAVDQIIIDTDTKTAGDSKSVNNSSKLTTTLEETIGNGPLALSTNLAGSNPGAAAYQLIDLTGQILVNNDIAIINSGNIDPVVGIYAQITHAALAFVNNTAASNANGSTSSGDVAQIIDRSDQLDHEHDLQEQQRRYQRRSARNLCRDQ